MLVDEINFRFACKSDKPVAENFQFKVGDKSLIIHKSAYHLFSLLISKRGFPSLQTRKTFGKIMSGNYRFLIPVIRVMAHNCEYLVLLLPIGSEYVKMINTPATKLLILVSFRYVKNNTIIQ